MYVMQCILCVFTIALLRSVGAYWLHYGKPSYATYDAYYYDDIQAYDMIEAEELTLKYQSTDFDGQLANYRKAYADDVSPLLRALSEYKRKLQRLGFFPIVSDVGLRYESLDSDPFDIADEYDEHVYQLLNRPNKPKRYRYGYTPLSEPRKKVQAKPKLVTTMAPRPAYANIWYSAEKVPGVPIRNENTAYRTTTPISVVSSTPVSTERYKGQTPGPYYETERPVTPQSIIPVSKAVTTTTPFTTSGYNGGQTTELYYTTTSSAPFQVTAVTPKTSVKTTNSAVGSYFPYLGTSYQPDPTKYPQKITDKQPDTAKGQISTVSQQQSAEPIEDSAGKSDALLDNGNDSVGSTIKESMAKRPTLANASGFSDTETEESFEKQNAQSNPVKLDESDSNLSETNDNHRTYSVMQVRDTTPDRPPVVSTSSPSVTIEAGGAAEPLQVIDVTTVLPTTEGGELLGQDNHIVDDTRSIIPTKSGNEVEIDNDAVGQFRGDLTNLSGKTVSGLLGMMGAISGMSEQRNPTVTTIDPVQNNAVEEPILLVETESPDLMDTDQIGSQILDKFKITNLPTTLVVATESYFDKTTELNELTTGYWNEEFTTATPSLAEGYRQEEFTTPTSPELSTALPYPVYISLPTYWLTNLTSIAVTERTQNYAPPSVPWHNYNRPSYAGTLAPTGPNTAADPVMYEQAQVSTVPYEADVEQQDFDMENANEDDVKESIGVEAAIEENTDAEKAPEIEEAAENIVNEINSQRSVAEESIAVDTVADGNADENASDENQVENNNVEVEPIDAGEETDFERNPAEESTLNDENASDENHVENNNVEVEPIEKHVAESEATEEYAAENTGEETGFERNTVDEAVADDIAAEENTANDENQVEHHEVEEKHIEEEVAEEDAAKVTGEPIDSGRNLINEDKSIDEENSFRKEYFEENLIAVEENSSEEKADAENDDTDKENDAKDDKIKLKTEDDKNASVENSAAQNIPENEDDVSESGHQTNEPIYTTQSYTDRTDESTSISNNEWLTDSPVTEPFYVPPTTVVPMAFLDLQTADQLQTDYPAVPAQTHTEAIQYYGTTTDPTTINDSGSGSTSITDVAIGTDGEPLSAVTTTASYDWSVIDPKVENGRGFNTGSGLNFLIEKSQSEPPRRSDILIEDDDDYAEEYEDHVISFDSMKSKKTAGIHPKPESQKTATQMLSELNEVELIPLIPIVIEQMRLDRVTAEELVILQQVFGHDFWQLIVNESQRDPSVSSTDEINATLSEILKRFSGAVETTETKRTKRTKRTLTTLALQRRRLDRQRALVAAQRRVLEDQRRRRIGRRNGYDYYNYYL